MKLGTSPITGTIFLGRTRTDKKGIETWNKKEDVTDNAIAAVFEHMMHKAKQESETGFYSYSYGDLGTLSFQKPKLK